MRYLLAAAVVAVLLGVSAPAGAQDLFTVSEWSVLGAHALDAASTQRCLGSGRCRELNPYLARFDEPVRFTGAKVGLAWVQLWLVRKVKPSHPRLAVVTNFSVAALYSAIAVRNQRVGR